MMDHGILCSVWNFEHSSSEGAPKPLQEYFMEKSLVNGVTTVRNTYTGLTDRIFVRTISNEEEPVEIIDQLKGAEVTHKYCQAMLFGKPAIDLAYNAVAHIIQSG
jgi:hypothetical protein